MISDDQLRQVLLHVTQALNDIEKITMTVDCEVSYETMQRSGFNRKTGWRRKYTLKDARSNARTAAIQIRSAWDILDPMIGG